MAVSVIALGWVLRLVDLPALGRILAGGKISWMLAGWVAFGLASLAVGARWHLVLRLGKCQVHAEATGRIVLVGHLFNTILFGPTGGDVAKSALYARCYGFPMSSILATCVLDRFLGGLGFFLFAMCTPGFAVYTGHSSERFSKLLSSPRLGWGLGALAVGVVAAGLLHRRFHSPFQRLVNSRRANSGSLMRDPLAAAGGLGLALVSHLFVSCVFLFSLKAVTQTPFSLAAVFWIFPVISLITSAPISFSGAGLREGVALFFLGQYGIPEADAVAASLLVLFTYLVWAGIGAVLVWRVNKDAERKEDGSHPRTLSVVIPTLNEAAALPETLARVQQVPEVIETIVVDGGSTDSTVEIAARLGCRVLQAPRGRGGQMRLGAQQARGDVVVFLHADTWLAPDAGEALLNCLRDRAVVGGGFWRVFREKRLFMAGSRLRCASRLLFFRRILGDQAMFVRRPTLEVIGGVPDIPLVEEFELCRKLRKLGRLALAGSTVTTSARRFAKLGIICTYLRMWHVTARY